MKPGVIYRGYFENAQATPQPANTPDGQEVIVSIYDTETLIADSDPETIIDLELSDNPVRISVVDNEEDKFTPIKSKQAEIRIHSSNSVDISVFAQGGDNRWKVEIAVNDTNYKWFIGFLSMNDLQMEFAPDPTEIVLTATDNLGLLKNVPLTDFTGVTPRGYKKISEFIAWCLSKTGLLLNCHVINNVREQNHPTDHLYHIIYLHSKTFEDEIGTCHNCYDALSKILGEYCYLTQWKGLWYIQNVDELDASSIVQAKFSAGGAFIEFLAATNYVKTIGENLSLSWVGLPDAPPLTTINRPLKEVKEVYDYDFPLEIIDNIDFSRGDFISIIALPPNNGAYEVDDWTIGKYTAANITPSATTAVAYIQREIIDGYEKDRKLVAKHISESAPGPFSYLRSNPIPVSEKDKFTVSIDFKFSNTGVGDFVQTYGIVLVGDDGNNYVWASAGVWNPASIYGTTYFSIIHNYPSGAIKTNWETISQTVLPLPVGGDVYIFLTMGEGTGSPDKHYANLQFTYYPFINGSYTKYTSQYHKVSQSLNTIMVREKQVFISDSPKKLFKGGLFRVDPGTGKYVLANRFFSSAHTPTPTSTDYVPFGRLQAFAVWNQYNRHFMKFEGTIDGIDSGVLDATDGLPDNPDLLTKYTLADSDPATSNKQFMMLHCEPDLNLCEMNCFLCEVYDSTKPKVYNDSYEFKYISQ